MQKTLEFTIDNNTVCQSIEHFLNHNGISGKMKTALKQHPERVLLNGVPSKLNTLLNEGDVLTVMINEKKDESPLLPWNRELDFVYEDNEIVVVNKPADMPVHPSRRHPDTTLANALVYRYGGDQAFHCITRLDKDTSGLVLVARNRYAAALLSQMMKDHGIEKEYLAICEGEIREPGEIEAPIFRAGASVKRSVDHQRGMYALTCYKPLKYNKEKDLTLLSITTKTGRTHQIRVHMAYIGHPLCGDLLYNSSPEVRGRHALHACRISLIHPTEKKPMVFEAGLPEDMMELMR